MLSSLPYQAVFGVLFLERHRERSHITRSDRKNESSKGLAVVSMNWDPVPRMWCRSGNWLSARKADLASTAERNAISVQDQLEN
jgi:hypothetical protein